MRSHNRNTYTCASHFEIWKSKDLPTLVLHLHLLSCIEVVRFASNERNNIHGYLVREHLSFYGLSFMYASQLTDKFIEPCLSCTRYRLVCAGYHGLDWRYLCQSCYSHERDYGGAVWIRDYSFVAEGYVSIDFRNHQRYIWIHSESRAVVYVDRT